ncbi:MAG: Asp-tRNA(Asn)/Glu-tRNA(Gln) amidotransferase subunit GatB [Chloroflexi bacterium]|nr:Asp-tRNA(Asn)/Glu-tRNA(Gln) amidotransferase subunit GatB [Chloroflexota bacterium]
MSVKRPYELVIGIECHVELATASKMFCGCSAKWFGAAPNTIVCPVCLGLPGALPVPNRRAIELAITAGIALHCSTPAHTKFDRKNYLYPDLPKGYQISQYDLPLSVGGWLDIPADGGGQKRVGIRRAHLEEDTGRLMHGEELGKRYSLIDFNRSGVPLLEIVSEPDLSSTAEALAYVQALREIVIAAGVSAFRLEEGAGRFDTNVSIRFTEDGETRWPPLSEIKNLNSYRSLEEAATYEADRLWKEWRAGGDLRRRNSKITVGWSQDRGETFLQRTKEDVDDYRYFPEPDLVALAPDPSLVAALRAALPELPAERRARFVAEYGLSDYDVRVLVADPALAAWYEAAVRSVPAVALKGSATSSAVGSVVPGVTVAITGVKATGAVGSVAQSQAKAVANWVTSELVGALKRDGTSLGAARVTPAGLGALVGLIASGEISGKIAKEVFAEMFRSGDEPAVIVEARGLAQVSDAGAIGAVVDAVLAENPKVVADYTAGNARALGALVGAVQRRMAGKANPVLVNSLIVERIARPA